MELVSGQVWGQWDKNQRRLGWGGGGGGSNAPSPPPPPPSKPTYRPAKKPNLCRVSKELFKISRVHLGEINRTLPQLINSYF